MSEPMAEARLAEKRAEHDCKTYGAECDFCDLLAAYDAKVVENAWLRDALRDLYALVQDGWLVRNTINDGNLASYISESVRLVNVLTLCAEILAPAPQPAPEPTP